MKQLRRFRIAAFTLVLLSIVGFCTAQRSAGLLLAAGAIAALSWYVTEGPRGKTLPRWTSNVLLFAVLINSVVDLLSNLDNPLDVLGRFQIWLILVKLYERKTAKDYAQLLTLAVVLMITSCTKGRDLLFGIVLVLFAILGFHVLLSYQLYAGLERAQDERRAATPAGYRLVPPVRPVTGRAMHGQMRWLMILAGSVVFLLSALVFVVMPRNVGAEQFGGGAPSSSQSGGSALVSGFSDRIDLRDSASVLESRQPVFTLKLTDAQGKSYHSSEPLRLRATALEIHSRRNPGTWLAPNPEHMPHETVQLAAGLSFTLAEPDPIAEHVITQHISMLTRTNYIYALYVPVSYTASQAHLLLYVPRLQSLVVPQSARLSEYTVQSALTPSATTMQLAHQNQEPRFYDAGNYQNGAVRQRAIQLLNEAGVQPFRPGNKEEGFRWNQKATQVFVDYLHSDLFSYSTDLSDLPPADPDSRAARDPIVRFLFDTHRGYCAHFASSLVAMCQSVQIQARIASGFIASEYDSSLDQYIVRQRNAHVWAEIRTGDFVWTTFDPTPTTTLDSMHLTQHTFADRLQLMYDGLEFQWDNGVVGFDGTAQAHLRDWFTNLTDNLLIGRWQSLRDQVNRFTKGFIFDFGFTGALWMGTVGLGLALAIYVLLRLMRRARKLRRSLHIQHLHGREYHIMLRQLGFYLDMLRTLRRHGWRKQQWKTPMQLADELEERHPHAAQLVRQVTDTFYSVRFGGRALDRHQLQRVQTLIAEIDQQL